MSRLADRLSGLDRSAPAAPRLGGLPSLDRGEGRGWRWHTTSLFVIVIGMLAVGAALVVVTTGRTMTWRDGLLAAPAPSEAVPAGRPVERVASWSETPPPSLPGPIMGERADPGAARDRGMALARAGALDGAAAAFREAIAREPRRGDLWNNLGVVLVRGGDLRGGVAAFREALALGPADAGTHRNLAIALDRQGRRGEAARHYRAFIEAAPPDHPDRAEVARRLADPGPGGSWR